MSKKEKEIISVIKGYPTRERNKCPMCGGKKNEWRILGGNPYTNLFAGDFCPHDFHGKRPGYNCF